MQFPVFSVVLHVNTLGFCLILCSDLTGYSMHASKATEVGAASSGQPKDAEAEHSTLITWAAHGKLNPHVSVCKPTALPSRHHGCGVGLHR
jgi:hypothetical protein